MAKGLLDYEDPNALGTVGLQARDYEMAGFDDADRGDRGRLRPGRALARALEPARATSRSSMIDSVAAEIDEFFIPDVELIGDIAHVLARLAAGCSAQPRRTGELVAACTRW